MEDGEHRREQSSVMQNDDWSCIACVAAMITGTTVAEFCEFCGHDGSEITEASRHPDKRRGFKMPELAAYLAKHGYHFGCFVGPDWRPGDCFMPTNDAVVTVASKTLPPPATHLVFFTGGKFLDPRCDTPQDIEHYSILEWWPLVQWEG